MNLIQNCILTNIFIMLVYLVFRSLFSQSQFFQANRVFLVAGSLFAVTLPWISPVMNFLSPAEEIPWMATVPAITEEMALPAGQTLAEPINTIRPVEIVFWAYWSILAIIVIINTVVWSRLLLTIRKSPRHRYGKMNVIILDRGWSAFSYFNTILYPKPYDPESAETRLILEHEQVHARQLHTLDNILLGTLRLIFFFNPFIHLLHKELKITHEYLADRHTSGADRTAYSRVLVSHQFKVPQLVLLHPFNKQSFLKRRLNMLMKNKPNQRAGWKYLLVVPLLAAMILGSSWNVTAQDQAQEKKNQLAADLDKELVKLGFTKTGHRTWSKDGLTVKAIDDQQVEAMNAKLMEAKVAKDAAVKKEKTGPGQVFLVVEEMPTFGGGTVEAFRKWTQANAKYPEQAKAAKISGTVYVSFVVNEKGDVVEPKIVRGVDPSLDNEVLRVLQTSPAWEPGKQRGEPVAVSFSIPVQFVLAGKTAAKPPVDPAQEDIEEKQVFVIVEEMPEFEGGDIKKFISWAQANVKYPAIAMENSISGTVEVSFVVSKVGQVKSVTIEKSVDPALDEAVINVVKSSPAWTPGKQRGKNVNVSFKIPIKFILQ